MKTPEEMLDEILIDFCVGITPLKWAEESRQNFRERLLTWYNKRDEELEERVHSFLMSKDSWFGETSTRLSFASELLQAIQGPQVCDKWPEIKIHDMPPGVLAYIAGKDGTVSFITESGEVKSGKIDKCGKPLED